MSVKKRDSKQRKGRLKRVALGLFIGVNVIEALIHIASAYAGHVRPETSGFASLMSMAFPFVILLTLALSVLDFFVKRVTTVIPIAAIVATISPIMVISPLTIPSSLSEDNRQKSFKLMTYNVMEFFDKSEKYTGDINPTLSHILDADPDIVALQECDYFSQYNQAHIYRAQYDSIVARYPYRDIDEEAGQSIFSKIPFNVISRRSFDRDNYLAEVYHLVVKGLPLYLINVHLSSIHLTDGDKELYFDLTKGNARGNIRRAKSEIILKLNQAFRLHAQQSRHLRNMIDRELKGQNIIICGDFNDTPLSHAYLNVLGNDFVDAYKKCGNFPTVTYNDNRFYFRIDHIFYRGALRAQSIERGKVKSSDHYSMMATFVVDDTQE